MLAFKMLKAHRELPQL